MSRTRSTPRFRARRVLAAVFVALLAFGIGSVLAVSAPLPANAAPGDVTITLPEYTPITHTPYTFTGEASPGDAITVSSPVSDDCHTVADGIGEWFCDVEFTASIDTAVVTAVRDIDDGNPATQESEGWEYYIALPPEVDVQLPGIVLSNANPSEVTGSNAWPGATLDVTVDGTPCVGAPADAAGDWTCTGPPLVDGDYAIVARQDVGTAISDPAAYTYRADLTGPAIPVIDTPYDSTLAPADIQTSDDTPTISGGAGTAEPDATVVVLADDFGPAPPVHPNGGAATTWCITNASATGAWSCTGSPLTRNTYWEFSVYAVDLAGNTSASPDDEFAIHVLSAPAPPTVHAPVSGYTSQSQRVHVSTTNLAEATMYVREAGVDICPPTPVPVPTFSCDTAPLSPGAHLLEIFQEDKYGTVSPAVQRTVTILAPPIPAVLKSLVFSFRILGPDGAEVTDAGLVPGDQITIVADGLPVGTQVSAEIHSTPQALGGATVGDDGILGLTATIPADVEIGDHEIVVSANAPGYSPTSTASPLTVHDVAAPPDDVPGKEEGVSGPHQGASLAAAATGPGQGFGDPSVFGTTLESPFRDQTFRLSVAGIVLSGSIAVAFILLVGFPAELLESTIRSNYDTAFGWLARMRRRIGRIAAPVAKALSHPRIGTALNILIAAFLLGFADPGFGFTGQSVRLLLAMILAVVAINIGLSLIVMRVAKRAFDVGASLRPMPAALAIVAISVLVSRLAGISPGFLFGIVLGVTYARELRLRDDARLGLLGAGLTIAAGLLAWLGYGLATAAMSGEGFVNNLVIEVLAAITLEALGTLVVALLPIEFLDGRTIFRWSKPAWLAAYAVTSLVFLFVVVPMSGNWGSMSAPVFGWGTLFAVFAVVAIATWAVFRRRPRVSSSSPADAAPPRRPRR